MQTEEQKSNRKKLDKSLLYARLYGISSDRENYMVLRTLSDLSGKLF